MEFYKRNSRDALNGMRGLTLEERGFYNAALDLIYEEEGPIGLAALRHETGARDKRTFNRILSSLIAKGRLIETADGRISDERAMFEIAMVESAAERMSAGGRKGGKKRALKEWKARQGDMFGDSSANSSGKANENKARDPSTLAHTRARPREAGAENKGKFGQSSGQVAKLDRDCSENSPEFGNDFNGDALSTLKHIDSDLREETPPLVPPSDEKPRKKSRRAQPIPPTWEPPEPTGRIATIIAGWPPDMLDVEVEKFTNYALANGRTCKDWDAAFRNWIIQADEYRRKGGRYERTSGWLDAGLA